MKPLAHSHLRNPCGALPWFSACLIALALSASCLDDLQGQPQTLKPVLDMVQANGGSSVSVAVQVLDANNAGVLGVPVKFRSPDLERGAFADAGGGRVPEFEVLSGIGTVQGTQVSGLAEATVLLENLTASLPIFATIPSVSAVPDASVAGSVSVAVIEVQP